MSPAASTRWCPTAEQVMILEEMYRGGVRTPNASHIQQITSHLSHYGKIEGKNVFYWFQNHKARDRQKIRKRLLGNNINKHHLLHFDHIMSFPILPCPTTAADHHHHHPHFHHFDQLPCCTSPSSSSSSTHHHLGLPQLPPFVSSPYFPPPHQPRTEEILARMANICTWKGGDGIHSKFGVENEMSITNDDNDRVIMREERDYDYDPHYHYDDCNYDDDDSTRRPLKTLELFPIKDKTSLKTDKQICGQPNLISSIKL